MPACSWADLRLERRGKHSRLLTRKVSVVKGRPKFFDDPLRGYYSRRGHGMVRFRTLQEIIDAPLPMTVVLYLVSNRDAHYAKAFANCCSSGFHDAVKSASGFHAA